MRKGRGFLPASRPRFLHCSTYSGAAPPPAPPGQCSQMCGIDAEASRPLIGGLFSGLSEALIPREVECGCDRGRGGEISKHTHTHTPNNPLILFIISQLFSAIHERNHAHKQPPMCRAEIQYKYSHLHSFISASFPPFLSFSSATRRPRPHITIPHQSAALRNEEVRFFWGFFFLDFRP